MRSLPLLMLLAVLSSCNGQTNDTTQATSKKESTAPATATKPTENIDGIVYFSRDNGLTWESKNEGLPAPISVDPGAIAVSGNKLALATEDSGLYLFSPQKNIWTLIPTDPQIIKSNPGALLFYKDGIYPGTRLGGVFYSSDQGKNWTNLNTGLTNLTIRKLAEIDQKLYAGTDAGLYSYNEGQKKWEPEYGNGTLQVNGITAFEESIYIGTNQGVFTSPKTEKKWKQILVDRSLHSISSDDRTIYAMTYNDLLSSTDKGRSWQSIQNGLPAQLYTFNVIKNGTTVFAAQWDGVYRKDNPTDIWQWSGKGVPEKLAVTNMLVYNGMIVISCTERKLRKGVTTDK